MQFYVAEQSRGLLKIGAVDGTSPFGQGLIFPGRVPNDDHGHLTCDPNGQYWECEDPNFFGQSALFDDHGHVASFTVNDGGCGSVVGCAEVYGSGNALTVSYGGNWGYQNESFILSGLADLGSGLLSIFVPVITILVGVYLFRKGLKWIISADGGRYIIGEAVEYGKYHIMDTVAKQGGWVGFGSYTGDKHNSDRKGWVTMAGKFPDRD